MIAAVSGYALGGGCELALVCDMIVASETAEFGQPEIMLGIIPGGGGSQRLARVIGKQRAMELVLTGRRVDAEEAYRLGFVNSVARRRNGSTRRSSSPRSWRAGRRSRCGSASRRCWPRRRCRWRAASTTSGACTRSRWRTEDRVEGMSAFIEKRKPRLQGPVSASEPPGRRRRRHHGRRHRAARRARRASRPTCTTRSPEALAAGIEKTRANLDEGRRARALERRGRRAPRRAPAHGRRARRASRAATS